MKNNIIKSVFFSLFCIGLIFRFTGIKDIQPMNSDEASYLRQARFMLSAGKFVAGVDMPVVEKSAHGVWRYLRRDDWSEKPCWLHTGFVAGLMLIFGIKTISGLIVNIIFSMATVVLIYFIVRRIRGKFAAVVSSGLLSVSGYWMLYSRSNWAEIDGVFFVILAVYLLIKATDYVERRNYLMVLLAGISGGLAVLCHYRMLYVIAPLGLMSVITGGRRKWFINGFLITIGYFGIILFAAGLIRLVADKIGGDIQFSGLIGALRERYFPTQASGHVAQTGFQPGNSLAFTFYILRNQGVSAFVLMLIGIPALIRMKEQREIGVSLVVFLLWPLLVLSMQEWVVERAAVIMVPFACIAAGFGASAIFRFSRNYGGRTALKITMIILVFYLAQMIVENFSFDIKLLRNKYGTKYVAEFFDKHPADVIYTDSESAITYGWFRPDLPYRKMDLIRQDNLRTNSNIYIIFDAQKYHTYRPSLNATTQLERLCEMEGSMVAEIKNMTTMWKEFLLDGTQANSLKEMLISIVNADLYDITTIRIYKVRER